MSWRRGERTVAQHGPSSAAVRDSPSATRCRLEVGGQHQPELLRIGSPVIRIVGREFHQQTEVVSQFLGDG